MSRANKRDTEIRTALETICVEWAVIRRAMPITRLRMEQARDRTGLTALLCPALAEMDDMNVCVTMIGEQVSAALAKLQKEK